jgi:NifU-like protein involved in Fe-S cluster formation
VNGATRKPDEFTILDHVESPYHRGRAPNASCAHAQRNAACGDWVRLERSVVSGQWSVVSGRWSVVGGRWSVVASSASTDE